MNALAMIHLFFNRLLRLTIIMFLVAAVTPATSQRFPVQSNVQVTPPYSLALRDYVAPGSERMAFNAMLTDQEVGQLDVRLRVTVEGQGIRIQTDPNFLPPRITLSFGFNSRLFGLDLEPYFRSENLLFSGLDRRQYDNSGGQLPEGVYRFCIEVLEYNRGVAISNTACATAWLVLNDPPLINLPKPNEKLVPSDPQFVRFQWTPRHTGSPNSAFTTEYAFSLVEIWPKGRNPNDAIQTTMPIYETTTNATSLTYGPGEPALVHGRQYAYVVRAQAKSGLEPLDLFRNDGLSEVHMFTYGDECVGPTDLLVESQSSRSVNAQWATAPVHTGSVVRYREKGAANWTEESILINDYQLSGLQPDTEYEIQVSGTCGFTNSASVVTADVRTMAEIAGDFACGSPTDLYDLDNQTPLPNLRKDDVIKAGDFEVKMTKVSGGNGTFSGEGQIVLPFMNHVKVNTAFTNIKVNEAYRMYEGKMHFTGATGQVLTDEQLEGVYDVFDAIADFEEGLMDVLDVSIEVMDSINAIVQELQTIEVFTDEEYLDMIDPNTSVADLKVARNEALDEAIVAAIGNGDIVEAAKLVARSKAYNQRAKLLQQQVSELDTITAVAVTFSVANDIPVDTGPGHDGIAPHYYKLYTTQDGEHYGPWFQVGEGQSLEVMANYQTVAEYPMDSISFVVGSDTLEGSRQSDGWRLTIPAGPVGTDRVLKAMYRDSLNVGIAAIATYARLDKKVVLVGVNGASLPDDPASYLTERYRPAHAGWEVDTLRVTVDASWDLNGNGEMYLDENNDLSAYPDEAKALIRQVKDRLKARNHEVDNQAHYLLFTDFSNSLEVEGFMPRKKQFGLLFGANNLTMAHELGHGGYGLSHPFVEFPNLSPLETQNLMDYAGGTNLRKYQWDQVHNPKWIMSVFDDEEEGAQLSFKGLFSKHFPYPYSNEDSTYTFLTPAGQFIVVPSEVSDVKFFFDYTGNSFSYSPELNQEVSYETYLKIPPGALLSFSVNGFRYKAKFKEQGFEGYKLNLSENGDDDNYDYEDYYDKSKHHDPDTLGNEIIVSSFLPRLPSNKDILLHVFKVSGKGITYYGDKIQRTLTTKWIDVPYEKVPYLWRSFNMYTDENNSINIANSPNSISQGVLAWGFQNFESKQWMLRNKLIGLRAVYPEFVKRMSNEKFATWNDQNVCEGINGEFDRKLRDQYCYMNDRPRLN
ncbi:MAG: fibronectin type III domain-containing protein, partial [Bacteroidota bacterium]